MRRLTRHVIIPAAIAGAKGRARGDADALWWVIDSMVLTIPVVAMIVMA